MTKELSKEVCERKINKIKGYVIARELYDDNNKLKPFTYYPNKKCGNPPYLYKKESQALKKWKDPKGWHGYKFEKGTKVIKFKKEMYLDRF